MSTETSNNTQNSSGFFVRVISALVLLPIAIVAIWYASWTFQVLLLVGGYLMIREWLSLTKVEPQDFADKYAMGSSLLMILMAYMVFGVPDQDKFTLYASMAAFALLTIRMVIGTHNKPRAFKWIVFGLIYVGLPLISLYWLHITAGYKWVLWVFLIVWGTDIGGYVFGKTVGGPKLAPRISPKKTWSGLIGGMVFAMGLSYLAVLYLDMVPLPPFPYAAVVLPILAQIGDIGESYIKRKFNAKDSSNLIPGHGGILDRVDGLVLVAPVVAIGFAFLHLDSF